MANLHPLFSISNHFDLTLKRVDRVLPLILRIVVLLPLCFYGLRDMYFDNFKRLDSDLIQIIIVCSVCSVILLPLPSYLFSSCRMKFNLEHEMLSLGDQDNTHILESHDQEQTSRPLRGNRQQALTINSKWSIKSLMLVQITPFAELLAEPEIITKLSQAEFEKKIIEYSQSFFLTKQHY